MKEMLEKLMETDIYTYRLTDGSYIVAEELEMEEDANVGQIIFITVPGQIVYTEDGYHITEWNITSVYDITELNSNNIITRCEATFELKSHYLKYVLLHKREQDSKDNIMENFFKSNIDIFDNLVEKDLKISNKRWDWKPENN
jgi:hypothetical protein